MKTIVIGVDPGMTGAIAVIGDGILLDVVDTPTVGRGAKAKQTISAPAVASWVRTFIGANPGAFICAALELVHAMPKQGVTSSFNFGVGCGVFEGVIATLGIPLIRPTPQKWKKHFNLIGTDKDVARGKAIDLFPHAPLSRKRDIGRADAILIAAWAYKTEAWIG